MLYPRDKIFSLVVFILVPWLGWQTATAQDDPHDHHPPSGDFIDLADLGMSGGSSHTGHDGLVGGRTAITTEAVLAYNRLRHFVGLDHATIDQIGAWAFANTLTNNTQAWGNDQQGVGIWYAMQGAKVGWMADATFDPQVVADISRTARLGDPGDVMDMVFQYGHEGYAEYLIKNGFEDAFINTLKMEPHYAGWMHDRCHGWLSIEGVAIAHDVNHLTVLSHDQMDPFMNDTWDWPQWPALEVSHPRVLEYFQSMVVLGDPLGDHLGELGDPIDPPGDDPPSDDPPGDDPPGDDPPSDDSGHDTGSISVDVDGDLWWDGFTAALAVHNETNGNLDGWSFRFVSSHTIVGTPWGVAVESTDLGNGYHEHLVSGADWGSYIPVGGTVYVGFNGNQGIPLGNSGLLDAEGLFDGEWIGDDDSADPPDSGEPGHDTGSISVEVEGELWWDGFTAALAVHNAGDVDLDEWSFSFISSHTICGTPWGVRVDSIDLGNGFHEHRVSGVDWGKRLPAGCTVYVGFNGDQGIPLGNSGLLDADSLFDGGWIGN